MRIFWYQGGLHAEPESPEEGGAMRLIWDSIKRASIGAEGAGDGPKDCKPSCSSKGEQSAEFGVIN